MSRYYQHVHVWAGSCMRSAPKTVSQLCELDSPMLIIASDAANDHDISWLAKTLASIRCVEASVREGREMAAVSASSFVIVRQPRCDAPFEQAMEIREDIECLLESGCVMAFDDKRYLEGSRWAEPLYGCGRDVVATVHYRPLVHTGYKPSLEMSRLALAAVFKDALRNHVYTALSHATGDTQISGICADEWLTNAWFASGEELEQLSDTASLLARFPKSSRLCGFLPRKPLFRVEGLEAESAVIQRVLDKSFLASRCVTGCVDGRGRAGREQVSTFTAAWKAMCMSAGVPDALAAYDAGVPVSDIIGDGQELDAASSWF